MEYACGKIQRAPFQEPATIGLSIKSFWLLDLYKGDIPTLGYQQHSIDSLHSAYCADILFIYMYYDLLYSDCCPRPQSYQCIIMVIIVDTGPIYSIQMVYSIPMTLAIIQKPKPSKNEGDYRRIISKNHFGSYFEIHQYS